MPSPVAVGSIVTNNIHYNKFINGSPQSTNMRVKKTSTFTKGKQFNRVQSKREIKVEASPYSQSPMKKTPTSKMESSKKSLTKNYLTQTQM